MLKIWTCNQNGLHQYNQVGEKTPPGTLKRDRPKSSCKTWYDQYSQVCQCGVLYKIQVGIFFCVEMCVRLTIFTIFELQAFLSKTIDTPALDLPPLGDEVLRVNFFADLYRSMFAGGPRWGGAHIRLRLQVGFNFHSEVHFVLTVKAVKILRNIHQATSLVLNLHIIHISIFHVILPGPKNFVLVPTRLPSPSD